MPAHWAATVNDPRRRPPPARQEPDSGADRPTARPQGSPGQTWRLPEAGQGADPDTVQPVRRCDPALWADSRRATLVTGRTSQAERWAPAKQAASPSTRVSAWKRASRAKRGSQ